MADRFSLRYLDRGTPSSDSDRARVRIATFYREARSALGAAGESFDVALVNAIQRELGVTVPTTHFGTNLSEFFKKCELRDFLDSLTLLLNTLLKHPWWGDRVPGLPQFVQRVFDEENLSYMLGPDHVVRYRVDSEFEANISSAVAVLDAQRFGQVRAAFVRARDDFHRAQPDSLDGIRNLFEAAESLYKIITESNRSLDEAEVKKALAAHVDRKMSGADPVAKGAAAKLVHGFADWVNAAHPYRHGHAQDAPVMPPLPFAIALMSSGAAYIRWLATLDIAA